MATRSVAPSYLIVALVALLPRVIGLGQFVTIDEINNWIDRCQRFYIAISTGDLAGTIQSPHPGVTTMWLGVMGILLHGLLTSWRMIDATDFATRLALMQLPPALINTAAVVVGYWLLRRLLSPQLALLAALLWALDPFVIGFSRVLHVDGLLGSFAMLSLLCASIYWLGERQGAANRSRSLVMLAASGACAALAMLSKSPGVGLAPTVTIIALWTSWRQGRRWQQTLRELIIWGLVTTAVVLVVCPAIWANPPQTITTLSQGVTEEGGEPHQTGNYFLGKPAAVPGPLIYPVTLALRLTPWTLLGLGLLGLFWRRTHPEDRRFLGLAALFALLFTAEISIFPKQFDRYLMPIFPAVDILAAAGIWAAVDGLKWPRVRSTIVTGLALVAIANVAWWYPYNLIAFNQLFGGAKTGEWALRMGWGEGMQDVAAWLNRQPNITEVMTVSTTIATLRPYVRQDTSVIRLPSNSKLPEKTGYVVLYLRNWQDGEIIQPFKSFFDTQQPVYTLQLKGVVYARIYEVVPTPQHQLHTSFGADVVLRGYDLAQDADSIDLTLYWETHGAPSDTSLFLHMLGADGQRHAQIDLPSVSSVWEAGRHYSTRIQLPLSGDLPAGEYQLALGMYDPQSFTRLPISGGTRVDPAAAGPDALLITTVQR